MHSAPLIDGGCFAGHDPATGLIHPIEAVVEEFGRFGVSRGVVGSYRAIYQDVREGNREAAAWVKRFPDRVIPLAIVHPQRYGESPETLLGWLHRELGIGVVGLFSAPAYYAIQWEAPAVRRIGQAAARLGMSLQAGLSSVEELAGVERAWGDLHVPVMIRWMAGHRYQCLASESAVAVRCRNFLFDVGNMSSIGMIEHAAATIGAERLFVASNSPRNLSACPHAMLHEANLDPQEREAISHKTLRTAFRWDASARASAAPSIYQADAWRSLCAQPKVDIHWHPDSWNLGEPALSEPDQLAAFERYGYERVILSSILALNYDLDAGNAQTAAWCARDPRVFGLIVVNPRQRAESLEQIARYADHPRFVGLKTIQDLYGVTLDDPLYEPLLQEAAARRLPVLAHLPGMESAARRHPQMNFIAAHATWGRVRGLVECPNVSFDFATTHALRHEMQLGRFIQAVGAERVLFGSDGPLVSPAWSLSKLMEVELGEKAREMILRENASRIFPKLMQGGMPHAVRPAHAVLR